MRDGIGPRAGKRASKNLVYTPTEKEDRILSDTGIYYKHHGDGYKYPAVSFHDNHTPHPLRFRSIPLCHRRPIKGEKNLISQILLNCSKAFYSSNSSALHYYTILTREFSTTSEYRVIPRTTKPPKLLFRTPTRVTVPVPTWWQADKHAHTGSARIPAEKK